LDARHQSPGEQAPAGSSVSDRLDSWKAIGQFLKRDVRTVQRWEATEGLPVYRHQHSKQGSVYAYKTEIDAWWKARRPSLRHTRSKNGRPRKLSRTLSGLPYPQMAIYALLALGLALGLAISFAKAKQKFLSRHKRAQSAALTKPVTIAVLPFESLSPGSQDANLAANITEELIGDCQRLTAMHVVDPDRPTSFRSTSASPQQIARLLNADKLLRGTASRNGNNIHITAELIDPATGAAIWSKTFDQSATDLLKTEEDIAAAIASDVESALAASPSPAQASPNHQ
jgi:TolB-like protein